MQIEILEPTSFIGSAFIRIRDEDTGEILCQEAFLSGEDRFFDEEGEDA